MSAAKSFDDEEARRFREEVRSWLADAIPKKWREFRGSMDAPEAMEVRRDWDRRLYEDGYAGLTWPRQFGGSEIGIIEEAIFYEECAAASAPEGVGRIGKGLAGPIIMRYGSEHLK